MLDSFVGLVYRAIHPGWAFRPDSGAGAAIHGGRFNRKGTPALYTSLSVMTAIKEATQSFPLKLQPLTICGYQVDCEGIADLTDTAICASLGIAPADVSCPWEYDLTLGRTPASWLVAEGLCKSGYAGAKVPSFAPGTRSGDVNLVFWRWASTLPCQVMVIDDLQALPRNQSSWK
jgi:RES domain-containing protein